MAHLLGQCLTLILDPHTLYKAPVIFESAFECGRIRFSAGTSRILVCGFQLLAKHGVTRGDVKDGSPHNVGYVNLDPWFQSNKGPESVVMR